MVKLFLIFGLPQESGQRLENDDQTFLELAGGNLLLQKAFLKRTKSSLP